jgi:hypothetical protein
LSDSQAALNEGDVVEFEVGQGRQGPVATKVKVVGQSQNAEEASSTDSSDSSSDSDTSSDSDSSSDSDAGKNKK